MKDGIPLEAFFSSDEKELRPNVSDNFDARAILKAADLIFGVDVMSEKEMLVFGKKKLEQIIRKGTAKSLEVLRVLIDGDESSDELEKLIALVQTVKGYHDYEGEGEE